MKYADSLRMRQILLPLVGLLLVVPASCGEVANIAEQPDPGEGGSGGSTSDAGVEDAGPSADGGDSACDYSCDGGGCDFSCQGECVPLRPGDFEPARLVWFGHDESLAPPCPSQAPFHQFTWRAEPSIPAASCSSCSCGPSSGGCALPTTITAHTAVCAQVDGSAAIPTNPPAGWTGECSTDNPIPPGLSCNGQPCVKSVTFGPLSVTDEACAPSGIAITADPPTATTTVKVCAGSACGACSPDKQCVPAIAQGFRQCVEQPGIYDCPAEGYTERFEVFDDLKDERHCSPCACGAPGGSYCAAWISIYTDSACTGQVSHNSIWSNGPSCQDITPPVWTLGSKAATVPTYHAGTCEAHGGEVEGAVVPLGVRTLCCLP